MYLCTLLKNNEMKRKDTGKTFLDLDDINKILPQNLKLNTTPHSRGVYIANNKNLISISNSRVYTKGYLTWYYVYADRYLDMGVKYMLFTIGMMGVVVLPMDVFQPFKKGCSWKPGLKRGEKRYRIEITKANGKMIILNSSETHINRMDISQYYIPFNNNDKL